MLKLTSKKYLIRKEKLFIEEAINAIKKYECIPFILTNDHKILFFMEDLYTYTGVAIFIENEDLIYLNKIYVRKDRRKKGIAKQLIDRIMKYKKRIIFTVHKDNKKSLKFFKEAKVYGYCAEL